MTDRDEHNRFDEDESLEQWVVAGLVDQQALAPITAAEVARAHADGLEFQGELPQSLRVYVEKPSSTKVVMLNERRIPSRSRVWLGHGLSAVLGAAAAAAILIWRTERNPRLLALGKDPGSVGARVPAQSTSASIPATIGPFELRGPNCCAGVDCADSKPSLRECASARRFIDCGDAQGSERYRIRIGRLAPSPTGRFLLDKSPDRSLEICVRIAGSPLHCTKAFATAENEEAWSLLPMTATANDLLAGVTVQLRWIGEGESMAEWSFPIQSNPTVLCNGISVKAKLPDGEPVGSLSMFLDDAYYVELGRSNSMRELGQRVLVHKFVGMGPQIYETESSGQGRFAVTVGPMSQTLAEATRWAVLARGADAKLVFGFDYRGNALRVPTE